MSEAKTYLKGLFVKKREGSPDFVVGQISIKREDLITELQSMSDDWINMDILREKPEQGKVAGIYAKINDWKPENKEGTAPVNAGEDTRQAPEIKEEDLPW